MPGRTVEETDLGTARDILLAIGGIADMEEGGPDAWAALTEVKWILDCRLADAKEAALKRKAEAEEAAADPPPHVAPMQPQETAAPLSSPTSVPSFLLAVAPAPAAATPLPTPVPPAPLESAASPLPFAATEEGDRPTPPCAAPRYDSVLPFRPPPSSATEAPASEPSPAAPAVAPHEEHTSIDPEFASWRAPSQSTGAEPSSDPGAAAGIPQLTLEQYAGMVVACELYPLYVQVTQSRYGVRTPDERAALDRFWQERLSAEPALAEQWERMREDAWRYFNQGS
jgi:hypothetical protein